MDTNTLSNAGPAARYLARLQRTLAECVPTTEVDAAVALVERAWREGRQVITLGNGGSSMTALHFITDWNKSIFLRSGKPFRGRTLVDNVGLLMAYGNDISFQDIFIEQLKNVLQPGDLVIAISGSGNSENVIRAVEYANAQGAVTLGLCGYDGGRLLRTAQHTLWARVHDMQLCEDVHAIFGHIVMQHLCGYGSEPLRTA
jgi:D-sedoheptulose 7-phosphate isomerase